MLPPRGDRRANDASSAADRTRGSRSAASPGLLADIDGARSCAGARVSEAGSMSASTWPLSAAHGRGPLPRRCAVHRLRRSARSLRAAVLCGAKRRRGRMQCARMPLMYTDKFTVHDVNELADPQPGRRDMSSASSTSTTSTSRSGYSALHCHRARATRSASDERCRDQRPLGRGCCALRQRTPAVGRSSIEVEGGLAERRRHELAGEHGSTVVSVVRAYRVRRPARARLADMSTTRPPSNDGSGNQRREHSVVMSTRVDNPQNLGWHGRCGSTMHEDRPSASVSSADGAMNAS